MVLTGDGGGKVPALARSLRGRSRVARTLLTWMRVASRVPDITLRATEVNGGPGVMAVDGQQRLISVWSLDIADGEIRSISSVVNPDKLAHLGIVGDFASLVAHTPATARDAGRSTTPRPQPRRNTMTQARIQNPALTVPGALEAAQQLGDSRSTPGSPRRHSRW